MKEMKLHELSPAEGSAKKSFRVGSHIRMLLVEQSIG